jgi:hypothetical protein
MERTDNHISVWFWARDAVNVPLDVRLDKSSEVDPSKWGKPYANFVNNNCNIKEKFGPNNIIINLTFCALYQYRYGFGVLD